jgi:hypothetical protein
MAKSVEAVIGWKQKSGSESGSLGYQSYFAENSDYQSVGVVDGTGGERRRRWKAAERIEK